MASPPLASAATPGLPTTCVVGAGPSGLACARAFTAQGLPVRVFERHDSIGGLWAADNPGTPLYKSAHFISSKTMSAFPGVPMPDDYPDYPRHDQILAYLHQYADHHGLREVITTGVAVTHADWVDNAWTVELSSGESHRFDHLICANGSQWHPNLPDIPGEFAGELFHSVEHWSPQRFLDKRVLIIGGGNSGVDIACDAATIADRAALSVRRGYWFIPKHIFGQPADVFADTGPELPPRISQAVFAKVLRVLVGRQERYGLPAPDHRIFETHPILNSEVFHHLSHGDLHVRPDVARFEGNTVHFVDGSSDDFDVVVCATGYTVKVPYLDESHFDWHHGRPQLYLNAFSRTNPHLHALGFTEGDGGGYTLFEQTAHAMASLVKMLDDPAKAAEWRRFVATDKTDVSGKVNRIDTARHANYLHITDYLKHLGHLRERFGWIDPETLPTGPVVPTA